MFDWIELLWSKRECFITPVQINNDNDYLTELKRILQLMTDTLIEIRADTSIVEESSRYSEALICAVDSYYKGYVGEAQALIDGLISDFKDDDPIAISNINNSISFGCFPNNEEVQFFRARCNDKITDYAKDEMLHIPFSKRSIVATERFSITGLPCLYLGTTSYVCWLELGRPADHQFNVSPVVLDNTQRLFNLSINITDFIETWSWIAKVGGMLDEQKTLETMFRLLILSIATSFKVKEVNRTFKSEYIIPQLIMISCMKRGLSGLTYYSKQFENDRFAYSVGVNVALFAYYKDGQELSDICQHIKLSDSFNYAMYKHLSVPQRYKKANLRIDKISHIQNIGSFSRQYPYRKTLFYEFDNYLFSYFNPEE